MTDEPEPLDLEPENALRGDDAGPAPEKAQGKRGKAGVAGVAVGIGSAAIVAALLYANRHHRKK